ncbi:YegS/Rv2252/BmrU family lipid kinase [Clostridium thermobutyricum]|uniref:Diacylglycerol kinase n=1 Tax=Clostridium thermobutyricum DSM 4928 TaxID=1121339 RepID=A0A1V4SWE4_9CLOT|nr:YegS/Rv2252/BmrU family lipid kinase [Clostridium thermobutyricum]OPX48642.1 diacylglycerol kinase [Clostridium thermobutyricum DSM 4928]
MKKVRFIYNPYSGEGVILQKLDKVIEIHQKAGYIICPYRIERGQNIEDAFDLIDKHYEYILVAGGDGTVDSVVNIMMKKNINLPLGILPVGTANDFGKLLDIPADVEEACKRIVSTVEPRSIDIGKINDKYFVNVASTGLFTDVSQKVDINLKNTLGKLAYYLKGIDEIKNFRKLKVKLTSNEYNYEGYMYLMLMFNGKTAGNLNIASRSDVEDGKLDIVLFKPVPIIEVLPLFLKVLRGEHLDSKKVIYFKTDSLLVECEEDIVTDIDGEKGPDFPLKVKCIKGGLKVLGIN